MAILAITPIQHGEADGTVKVFAIGDTITGLTKEQTNALVQNGSAVNTDRKVDTSAAPLDDETLKRDALIAKVAAGQAAQDDEGTGMGKGAKPGSTPAPVAS